MKVIKPSYEILDTHGLTPYQIIEKVGRTCYKSENLITEQSAENFVYNLISRKHFAMLEHSNIALMCSGELYNAIRNGLDTTYLHLSTTSIVHIVSGSFRAWYDAFITYRDTVSHSLELDENVEMIANLIYSFYLRYSIVFKEPYERIKHFIDAGWYGDVSEDFFFLNIEMKDFEYLDNQTLKHLLQNYPENLSEHLTWTIKFICDRGVSHELVRHRPASFAQESTRYCNYSKDKFGNEITVIKPVFFDRFPDTADNVAYDESCYSEWLLLCERAEKAYFTLLERGATPEQARSILPNSLKTEIFITATEKEWQHIFNLRAVGTTGKPHPQMQEIMKPCFEEMKKLTCLRIR